MLHRGAIVDGGLRIWDNQLKGPGMHVVAMVGLNADAVDPQLF